jgi:hypothetical protein
MCIEPLILVYLAAERKNYCHGPAVLTVPTLTFALLLVIGSRYDDFIYKDGSGACS